jgi:hypothetical protein
MKLRSVVAAARLARGERRRHPQVVRTASSDANELAEERRIAARSRATPLRVGTLVEREPDRRRQNLLIEKREAWSEIERSEAGVLDRVESGAVRDGFATHDEKKPRIEPMKRHVLGRS